MLTRYAALVKLSVWLEDAEQLVCVGDRFLVEHSTASRIAADETTVSPPRSLRFRVSITPDMERDVLNEKICSLRERRPADVSENFWNECVAWASIAHCNICFSEGHAKYSEMLRFEHDLDEKLKGPIDLNTLKWIGELAAQTGSNGERYMENVRWRHPWDDTLRAAGQ